MIVDHVLSNLAIFGEERHLDDPSYVSNSKIMSQNTLFKYFSKVKTPAKSAAFSRTSSEGDIPKPLPKPDDQPSKSKSPEKKRQHTPERKHHQSPEKKHRHSAEKRQRHSSDKKRQHCSDKKKKSIDESGFDVGDLVWGKLEGYPWWPAIVVPHPTAGAHYRRGELHVQFFEEKPSRAWVKYRFVQRFIGDVTGPVTSVPDPAWKKALAEANDALSKTKKQREELMREFPPSDDENGDDIPSGESDQSKENVETSHDVKRKRPTSRKSPSAKSPPLKRARIHVSDDEDDGDFKVDEDSGDEFKPPPDTAEESDDSVSSGVPEENLSAAEESPAKLVEKPSIVKLSQEEGKTPKGVAGCHTPKSAIRTPTSLTPSSHIFSSKRNSAVKSFSMFAAEDDDSGVSSVNCSPGDEIWEHLKVDFLKPENIRDRSGRRPDDPNYDPRTLKVPQKYLDQLSPGMRQWWQFKSEHFDVVLFFKVGKFYELYHMDATVGVNELNLLYMKGKFAHSGFPEISYGRFADRLLTKGYKVARIEQTETPEQNKERCSKMGRSCTKWDKVVRRELCRITTPATRLMSFQDENVGVPQPKFLLALCQKMIDGPGENIELGVAFADTSVGRVLIGQFIDDRCCSRLRTMMAHYVPATILLERGKSVPAITEALKHVPAEKELLASDAEFMTAKKTLKTLSENSYFVPEGGGGTAVYPAALRNYIEDVDGLALTPKSEKDLALRSLGAVLFYLKDCLIDDDVISMGQFDEYEPVDWTATEDDTEKVSVPAHIAHARHLVLDGVTLNNLDVLVSNITGTEKGTLIEQVDHCCTPFGKRLLRDWLCRPLCDIDAINERLDAVEELLSRRDLVLLFRERLRCMPDFQRLLPKLHSEGSSRRTKSHPDSRAVLFEMHKYSKRKIECFLRVLDGFKSVMTLQEEALVLTNGSSKLLQELLTPTEKSGKFPCLKPILDFFDEAFDHGEARKNGNVVPGRAGVDENYDNAKNWLNKNAMEREKYLKEQSQLFGCKVVFVGTGRNRFQMEVTETAATRASKKHELSGQRKGYRRFVTAETKRFLSEEMKAEDAHEAALQDIGRSIMGKFDSHFHEWAVAVECIAFLDVLMSFALYAESQLHGYARPEIVAPSQNQSPFIHIVKGRHPCLSESAIPNDINLGGELPPLNLLTGPNMGGKSTFMRQAGLFVILSQIGCFVPAESCRLTSVDRIFTRIGASDSIVKGESTFYVELSEASAILKHASPYSVVLVDELGRGTATFDGVAIAGAVVKALCNRGSLSIFSTHYHNLVDELGSHEKIALTHMACMVERNQDDIEDPTEDMITFLYTNESGSCPKSYGFNVAKLAGLPDEIIRTGHRRAMDFEEDMGNEDSFVQLLSSSNAEDFCTGFEVLVCG
ncbi:unnamed protein product [Notodromas monacha]|uniref:DNA mismatch repair protein n=1 Tax=Notodromas monacha TaxID=399045 RepID=A0A7R9BEZ1_9CRUS|nr:unnamed protein product [Notodromas monacha]CAG0914143.1 unnamed protein product [Notodromas monacha]